MSVDFENPKTVLRTQVAKFLASQLQEVSKFVQEENIFNKSHKKLSTLLSNVSKIIDSAYKFS